MVFGQVTALVLTFHYFVDHQVNLLQPQLVLAIKALLLPLEVQLLKVGEQREKFELCLFILVVEGGSHQHLKAELKVIGRQAMTEKLGDQARHLQAVLLNHGALVRLFLNGLDQVIVVLSILGWEM